LIFKASRDQVKKLVSIEEKEDSKREMDFLFKYIINLESRYSHFFGTKDILMLAKDMIIYDEKK